MHVSESPLPLAGLATLIARPLGAMAGGRDGGQILSPSGALAFVVSAVAQSGPALVVVPGEREAGTLAQELADLIGAQRVVLVPAWETLPHERLSPSLRVVGERLWGLRRFLGREPSEGRAPDVAVMSARSFIQPVEPAVLDVEPVRLRVGREEDLTELAEQLTALGYTRVDLVAERGDFAVRGGILDVFSPLDDHPVRVQFWGDEITELRSFSVIDQRSLSGGSENGAGQDRTELIAPPVRELLITPEVRERARAVADGASMPAPVLEALAKLAEGVATPGVEALRDVLSGAPLKSLADMLEPGTRLVLGEVERVAARAVDLIRTDEEFRAAAWQAASEESAPIDSTGCAYRDVASLREQARARGCAIWEVSSLPNPAQLDFGLSLPEVARPGEPVLESVVVALRGQLASGGVAVVVAQGQGTVQRVVEQLRAADLPVRAGAGGETPQAGVVTVLRGALANGVRLAPPGGGAVPDPPNVLVLTEAELTGAKTTNIGPPKRLGTRRRDQVDPLALKAGDYVVHDQHGIGRFVELVERTVGGARREYVVVEYASSKRGHPPDRLYVPMDALDQLSRYVGGESPALSKMGGSDWATTKRQARKAVREVASELVRLYAARQSAKGHAFGPDSPWQSELEGAFAHAPTPDQLTTIGEVKADMEREVPMDRVVCGDVGFGKTEIAVRAAFKAVQDGKQVVVLAPTTLLADQHLRTFSERMAPFPVTVKGLSRFTDPAESKDTVAKVADGQVDVLIGTHRVLQSKVKFKDLGLVIVDEEQRFGVEHKEHIKALRVNVDVLTLSATPIPRTLEMSLTGIRDMSTILTPPEERFPVLTYVGAHDEKQVAAALRRELVRDGQVFYIHNRVSSIDKTAARLKELVPEARVAIAHGQMGEEQLEATAEAFWRGEHDILVCTTIVESGLDIANANTLVVERADTLGLAQLHQLRGRVGRGGERAFAYFLYDPERSLSETAHERLATIAQHSSLGSGMAVAMRDLEIRGAGNVLGHEQSGHIAGVGFDLYIRLVGEAVVAYRAALDGEEIPTAPSEVRIDLPVDAHIPVAYVASERLRLEAYRGLASAEDHAQLEAKTAELEDRYGPVPPEVARLREIAELKLLCRRHAITEAAVAGRRLRLSPVSLLDSQQVRLARLFPGSQWRATSGVLTVPLPSSGFGEAAPDGSALIDFVRRVVHAIHAPPQAQSQSAGASASQRAVPAAGGAR
ncbi:transcription-repair coupling factor [Segniliparus rotundus DSM 44985]|uniref:Transcription-repair-coupling factor n=2 Tax=Segniliparus rotundus TaxID=286802 RepID=D6ZFJ7_SEGRD|nr:transcription-repair coupling factor [Segniliparus rotundus DSM 44985]